MPVSQSVSWQWATWVQKTLTTQLQGKTSFKLAPLLSTLLELTIHTLNCRFGKKSPFLGSHMLPSFLYCTVFI